MLQMFCGVELPIRLQRRRRDGETAKVASMVDEHARMSMLNMWTPRSLRPIDRGLG